MAEGDSFFWGRGVNFRGFSTLGKDYSAKAIQQRCNGHNLPMTEPKSLAPAPALSRPREWTKSAGEEAFSGDHESGASGSNQDIIHWIMKAEQDSSYLPFELRKHKKKRKRKPKL